MCVNRGMFVNPDNLAFQAALNARIYVDKSGILNYTNSVLGSTDAFICNSRPRRFGKSVTANMLTAYYSKGCDSEEMFSRLEVSQAEDFRKHLNQYDVIHWDIQWCMGPANGPEKVVSYISEKTISELRGYYPDVLPAENHSLAETLARINTVTGRKFIVIIDEWDVLIRDEAAKEDIQNEYIRFLRGIFKGTEPTKYIQLAYLTGILPIKKEKTQSALNNFDAVNYTDRETPWTRIIEHKWFEFGKDEDGNGLPKTVISREYSSEWKLGDEPYYPVNDEKNSNLYKEYKKMADAQEKVIFGGRLGEYKYYDMDQVIAVALELCEKKLK